MLEPNVADATATDLPCLLVDVTGGTGSANIDEIAAWCQRQPLPIIALGQASPGIERFSDVIVQTESELAPVLAAIDTNPEASAVLVQVLRASLLLPVPQALAMESLAYSVLQAGREHRRWLSSVASRAAHVDPDTLDSIVTMQRRGDHLDLTLNSPQNRNALSVPMRDALTSAFKLVAMDQTIRTVSVRGNGPCFSAGGDLTEFGSSSDGALAHSTRMLRMPAQYLAPHRDRYTFYLKGTCVGAGIEMPAYAGRLVAASDTSLRLPEVGMGLIPGAGGCVSIPRRIGRHRAAWMAITGASVDAETALAWGLVDEISEDEIGE